MKSIAKKLSLFVLSIFLSLFLAELLIRIFVPQQLIVLHPGCWRPDNLFGWRHQENINTIVNTGEGPIHFVTDSNGYRISYETQPQKKKKQPEISIITLGDSFLEALQVENKFTIPEVIKNHLEKKYNKVVDIVNTGVGGWDPNHYYLEAKKSLSKKYDLGIVFLYVSNDCIITKKTAFLPRIPTRKHYFRFPENFGWKELVDAFFYPFNDYFETRSHLYIFLKSRFRTTLSKIGLTASYFPLVFRVEEKKSKRWRVTAEVCQAIKTEFARHNIPVFFVLLPAPYQVHEDVFNDYVKGFNIPVNSVDLEQPNKMLKQTFESNSLALIDPLLLMRQKAKEGLQMYGRVDNHFNIEGHRVVAEYIIQTVEVYLNRAN